MPLRLLQYKQKPTIKKLYITKQTKIKLILWEAFQMLEFYFKVEVLIQMCFEIFIIYAYIHTPIHTYIHTRVNEIAFSWSVSGNALYFNGK